MWYHTQTAYNTICILPVSRQYYVCVYINMCAARAYHVNSFTIFRKQDEFVQEIVD
jgi:hypothetical protein